MQITVLSLLQPWASLVVMGAKKIETRSFNTPFRGELYIHASLGKKYGDQKLSCRELCYQDSFKRFIDGGQAYDKLPFGQIIGKVSLIDTYPTHILKAAAEKYISHEWEKILTPDELEFGDYSPNRFGWLLSHPEPIEPIPAKGKLGFWNYELTD
jgi:hypothetical protein